MDARTERLAENESLFRAVNELIEQTAASMVIGDHVYEFVCECSDGSCTMLLPMTVTEYERVRSDPTQFLVANGHQRPDIEFVVASRGAYLIVRKVGEPAEYVSERDPRTL